jgi:hypothetical protein
MEKFCQVQNNVHVILKLVLRIFFSGPVRTMILVGVFQNVINPIVYSRFSKPFFVYPSKKKLMVIRNIQYVYVSHKHG